mgnify:CR=1 FL=1
MTLNSEQKKSASTIFTNLGTVIFVSVVLGKYIKVNLISELEFFMGILATVVCFSISIYIVGDKNPWPLLGTHFFALQCWALCFSFILLFIEVKFFLTTKSLRNNFFLTGCRWLTGYVFFLVATREEKNPVYLVNPVQISLLCLFAV